MITTVLEKNKEYNSYLQTNTIRLLENIFSKVDIINFENNSYLFQGVRGRFEGIDNYSICFKFGYNGFIFEFDLAYDQLEYYISKNGKLLKECNLEDYTEDENEMANTFIKYLKKDLNKLKIPYNNSLTDDW
jgi:hypothetical protein